MRVTSQENQDKKLERAVPAIQHHEHPGAQLPTLVERFANVQYPRLDVLGDEEARALRDWSLQRALRLGNLYKHKVRIWFCDSARELQSVDTTIWDVSRQHIALKGGVKVPIRAIVSLEF